METLQMWHIADKKQFLKWLIVEHRMREKMEGLQRELDGLTLQNQQMANNLNERLVAQ